MSDAVRTKEMLSPVGGKQKGESLVAHGYSPGQAFSNQFAYRSVGWFTSTGMKNIPPGQLCAEKLGECRRTGPVYALNRHKRIPDSPITFHP
jgi:hypothetical protein